MEPDNIAARIKHRGNDMNALKFLAGVALCATMAACGGGGSAAPNDSAAQAVKKEGVSGTFGAVSGSILPDPAKPSDQITVTINTNFSGSTTPAMQTFDVPVVVRQVGTTNTTTGAVRFRLETGSAGFGDWVGTGAVALPKLSPGTYTFGIVLDPGAKWEFSGTVPAEVFGQVVVKE